jgi:hypothetical protein
VWLWKACVLVLAAVGAVACRSTTDAVRTTRVGDDGPGVQKPGAPLVLAGPCGGFETRSWAADPVPLLRDRLRITPIVGLVESERDYNVMAAPHSQEAETRLFLEDEGRKLVVFVEETFRRADDSAELVRGMSLPATFHAEARTLASGLDVAIARPPALDTSSEAVLVGGAFVASRDRTVQRIAIYVNPLAVRAGSEGCADLVNQMIETIAPGERVLDLTAGPRALFGDIVLDVPANHMIVRQEGVDFSVWRIYPVLPFSSDFELLVVYVGDHPNFHPSESAITRQATILGKTTQWHEWSKDGMTRIEALVRSFHLVATAKDAARARTLAELAEKGLRSPEPSTATESRTRATTVATTRRIATASRTTTVARTGITTVTDSPTLSICARPTPRTTTVSRTTTAVRSTTTIATESWTPSTSAPMSRRTTTAFRTTTAVRIGRRSRYHGSRVGS